MMEKYRSLVKNYSKVHLCFQSVFTNIAYEKITVTSTTSTTGLSQINCPAFVFLLMLALFFNKSN